MINHVLHPLAANPIVYDLIQIIAGRPQVNSRIQSVLSFIQPGAVVLDLGGGTGLNGRLLPKGSTYICLDSDPLKLAGFRTRQPTGMPLLGDATCAPIATSSVDVVLCTAVSHHIPDQFLPVLFAEAIRVLRPDGKFVFMDAVLADRWCSRVLWHYDRGRYPKQADVLRNALTQVGQMLRWESFQVFHSYVIGIVQRRMN